MTSRYSSPPDPVMLDASTRRLTAANKALEAKVGHLPMPVSVAAAALELTDPQRLAVLRELKQRLAFSVDGLREYEAEVRGRLGR
jgi:hypothetical protein